MHRQTHLPRHLCWGLLVLCGLLRTSHASAQAPVPEPSVLVVPGNVTKTVQMSTKLRIAQVRNENPKVVRVQTLLEDPSALLVTGLTTGQSRVILTDIKNNVESFDVRVPDEQDIVNEQLRKRMLDTLGKLVPQGAFEITIGPNNTVILSGTVQDQDKADIALQAIRGFLGGAGNIVNGLRIGGVQQVQLEVVVAVVNRAKARTMDFRFFINGQNYFFNSFATSGPNATNSIAAALTSAQAAAASTSSLAFGVVGDKNAFAVFLNALKNEGITKILAEPRVVTLSGKPAYVVSGGETPLLTSSGQGAPTISYRQFGTVVNFLPIVLGNGKIHLEVRPELSSINAANGVQVGGLVPTSVPGFDIRSAQVAVQLEDGQTLAIGGLIDRRIVGTISRIPILGEVPFLSTLFSTKTYAETEEEMLILVTPRLVDPMACTELPKFWPGRETRAPDDFEFFLEGILEAPRGPRQVTVGCGQYRHPYTAGPTAGVYPCGDAGSSMGKCWNGSCGNGCATGNCGHGYGSIHNKGCVSGACAPASNSINQAVNFTPAMPLPQGNIQQISEEVAVPSVGLAAPMALPVSEPDYRPAPPPGGF